jgi:hypothetical protein
MLQTDLNCGKNSKIKLHFSLVLEISCENGLFGSKKG